VAYRFAAFTLDPENFVLTIHGRTVPLPRKVAETLAVLVAHAGAVVTKEQLLGTLWPDGFVEESNLSQNVYLLRRIFRQHGIANAIETLPRRGYRFVLAVSTGPSRSTGRRRPLVAAVLIVALAAVSGASPITTRHGLDVESARLYQMGRYYWNLRTTASMLQSLRYFRAVIERAPANPLGYAGLADAFAELADSCFTAQCVLWSREAEVLAHKAVAVDPDSSAAVTSLAMVTRIFAHDDTAAEHLFQRAIDLDPENALAHQWYGNFLVAHGALAAARRELERAVALEPVSTATYAWLARDCYYQHEYRDAERYAREALALTPRRIETTVLLGLIYEAQGRYRDAAGIFQALHRFADRNDAEVLAAAVYAKDGRVGLSRILLKRNARHFTDDPYVARDLILAYVTLHAYDTALKYLAHLRFKTLLDREFLALDPRFDAVRHDRRFAAVI
jgi:DNA-binding winged helix-turn-helix (wHTH) protein/Tfp pilus assembly protein PilF